MKRIEMKNRIITLLIISLPMMVSAQILRPISYREYISRVSNDNIAYASEKLNVPIAEAEVRAARVFHDPSVAVEYSDNQDHTKRMGKGWSVELSRTFTFGTRRAGIRLAKSEKEMSEALLGNFFNDLRAQSTEAYFEAVKQTQIYKVKENSYKSISELADGDSIRFSLGKITEVDAMQSRVEEGMIHNELLEAKNALLESYIALSLQMGTFSKDTIYVPEDDFQFPSCEFSQDKLIDMALERRSDLKASLKNIDVAKRALSLVRREKGMEFDLAVGYSYNSEVRNEIAPAPKFNGITVGITVPLKFSSLNKGSIQSAKFKAQQAEQQYRQAQIEIMGEVTKCYQNYLSSVKQVDKFKTGILNKSKDVMDGKKYSYSRGETSLLEVLEAQRNYNDVRTSYIESMFNKAISLVELEKSVAGF